MSLIEIIQDNRWWVLAVCLPLLAIYGRVLFLAAFGTGAKNNKTLTRPPTVPLRKMPPKPGSQAKPGSQPAAKGPAITPPEGRQEVLPDSLGAGLSGHQKAGAAKTVKMPVATPKPTDLPLPSADKNKDLINEEMDGLFGTREVEESSESSSGLRAGETQTGAINRKASRLLELGFHHSIPSDDVSDKPKVKTEAKTEQPTGTPATLAPALPAAKTLPTSAPATGTPEAPRSSTAELTNILERIDKFLAEDTPSSATLLVKDTGPAETGTTADKTDLMQAIDIPIPPKSPKTDTTKAILHKVSNTTDDEFDDEEKLDEVKLDDEKDEEQKTDDTPSFKQKKTQPMWARPDVTDDDLATNEPRKTTGSSDTTGDRSRRSASSAIASRAAVPSLCRRRPGPDRPR
jgi:hypothetical protein